VTERVVPLVGGDAGFAALVASSGEQVPGALRLGQLAAAAELPEVQVRSCCPAPSFGAPVTQHRHGVQVGHSSLAVTDRYLRNVPPAEVIAIMQRRQWAEPAAQAGKRAS
jgi:hypothetical protein